MADNTENRHSISNNSNYDKYLPVWNLVDDCIEGGDTIKQRRTRYLPMTEGMAADKVMGEKIYNRYLHNAVFPEYTHDFFIASTGLLKQKDPVFNFPDVMDENFVPCPSYSTNKTLYDVYSEVQDEVMKYCRCGVLLDVPDSIEKKADTFPVLWMQPMPPASAIAIAIGASVTVSIAADMNGTFIMVRDVSLVSSDVSSGRKSAYCVTRVTSS